jgi:hypothetical protein
VDYIVQASLSSTPGTEAATDRGPREHETAGGGASA